MSDASQGFSGQNWADIIDILSQTAGGAAKGIAQGARSKRETREAKRQTYADLFKNALKRDFGLFKMGQDYSDDVSDLNTDALQSVARGFADTFKGSSFRRRRNANV